MGHPLGEIIIQLPLRNSCYKLGLVADPVIEAIARLEFEDGLRTESSLEAAGTLVVAAPSQGSILHHPGGAGWSLGRCGCHKALSD